LRPVETSTGPVVVVLKSERIGNSDCCRVRVMTSFEYSILALKRDDSIENQSPKLEASAKK
jgi:hypothetical protein